MVKVRHCNFNLSAHSGLHIETQILTIYVGKIVKLKCFGYDNIAEMYLEKGGAFGIVRAYSEAYLVK